MLDDGSDSLCIAVSILPVLEGTDYLHGQIETGQGGTFYLYLAMTLEVFSCHRCARWAAATEASPRVLGRVPIWV